MSRGSLEMHRPPKSRKGIERSISGFSPRYVDAVGDGTLTVGHSAREVRHHMSFTFWIGGVVVALATLLWLARRYADHLGRRAALRFRSRIDRYKLARRRFVRAGLLADPDIALAVREHAATCGVSEA